MCYQTIELYSACRCLYCQHPVDRCALYGRPGHSIQKKTVFVGYGCRTHNDDNGVFSGLIEPFETPSNSKSRLFQSRLFQNSFRGPSENTGQQIEVIASKHVPQDLSSTQEETVIRGLRDDLDT